MSMSKELRELIEKDKKRKISREERIRQIKSFVYGNIKLHNDHVTREMVDAVFENMIFESGIISDKIE